MMRSKMPLYDTVWPDTTPPNFSVWDYCKKVGTRRRPTRPGAARHRHEVVVPDVRPAGAERAARRLQRVHLDGQIRAARRRHGDGAGEALPWASAAMRV